MDKEAMLGEFVKDTRQTIREIQARIYNLSTTFVVFSFAITAFAWKDAKEFVIPITLFSDMAIAAVLIYLYTRIFTEYKLVRLALEKHESVLMRMLDGEIVSSQDIVAPPLDTDKTPAFSVSREVNLFLWSAAVVTIKAALVIVCRLWFPA